MKNWDLHTPSAKLEMALKTLRTVQAAVETQWLDEARRKFHEEHLAPVESRVSDMLDAIQRLAEVLTAAERQTSDENE